MAQTLLSSSPRQFLFTLLSSYFFRWSRFQEHMSLGSALLIRGLFCLWVSLFSALVVDCIVTGVSVGVLPSRQKVFIGLLMSLPRVVSSANLHLSFCAQSEQSPDLSRQGLLSLLFRRRFILGNMRFTQALRFPEHAEMEDCQQCWLDFSLSWESGACVVTQRVNKKWPSVTPAWPSPGSSLLQHLLS